MKVVVKTLRKINFENGCWYKCTIMDDWIGRYNNKQLKMEKKELLGTSVIIKEKTWLKKFVI